MQAWETFLHTMRSHLGEETADQWLLPLKVIHFDACNLYLEAETNFQVEWFEEHARSLASKHLVNNNFHPIKVHLTCQGDVSGSPKEKKEGASPVPFQLQKDSLLDEYTKESFFFGLEGVLLGKVFDKLVEERTISFNPLFLYGPSSSGKTHLLQALTKRLKEKGLNALYTHAETFTENVVRAIRTGHMREFRKAHRQIDALIIDDVQYFAKRGATQEELFHTFNALQSMHKQIILSGDKTPSTLADIEPRLTSRFEWGLSLKVPPLNGEELTTLIQRRAEALGLILGDKEISFLLEKFSSSLHAIQRALGALCLRTHDQKKLTLPEIEYLLKDLLQREEKEKLTPEKIVQIVAAFYGVKEEDILGKSQTKTCALPRKMAMLFCRKKLSLPYSKIGTYFARDHSTVMTSVRSLGIKVETKGSEAAAAFAEITQKIER